VGGGGEGDCGDESAVLSVSRGGEGEEGGMWNGRGGKEGWGL